jgi:hypothetical protein
MSQIQKKMQSLQTLAKNPGTTQEGEAAQRAIERLQKRLENEPRLNCPVDHDATISDPIWASYRACPWKDKLFYAVCMHMNCIPFLTWNDTVGKHRTNRQFQYFAYGNVRNVTLVSSLFHSLCSQIQQELRKNKNKLHRIKYDSFKMGIINQLFDQIVPEPKKKKFTTTIQASETINNFAKERHVNHSFILLPNPRRYFVHDLPAGSLGANQAGKLSFNPLIT